MNCPLCNCRVSNWELATGKVLILKLNYWHKTCLIDYKLRTGKDHPFLYGVNVHKGEK